MIHLHVHTDASFLDGMNTIKELVDTTKKRGLPAVAITDHGTMANTIKFYKYAKQQGINPLVGVEAYVEDDKKNDHLVLLAKDYEGFVKLNSIMFKAWHNFYRKPRIKAEWLEELSGHVIATGACLAGWANKSLLKGDLSRVEYLKNIFGDDFYLEVQENAIPEQVVLNKAVFEAADKLDIKVVATSDAHYLNQEDFEAHKVLLGIANFKSYGSYEDAWLKPRSAYKSLPDEVFKNTFEVAEKCNVELDFSTKMPKYSDNEKQEFVELVWSNFAKRVPDTEEYRKRAEYELSVIQKMGFEGYFMLLWDVINHAKQNNIPVGAGRGSASGSLLSYIVGITDIDPMPYGLIFERFLNPSRVSLPDIDVDFSRDERDMVFNYVKNKYGEDRVAKIMTFGKFGPKMAFKDVARVRQIPYNTSNNISKTIPNEASTVEEAKQMSKEFRAFCEQNPDIEFLCNRLVGVNRHSGIHAAGVIISPVPLVEVAPLQWDKSNGPYVAADKDDAEDVGLVKYDFLGLQTLTIVNKANVDISNIDLNDSDTLSVFREGDTNGVFQFESSGMRKLLMDMQPDKFEDIIAANALYRPGPLENGLVDLYVKNKKDPSNITYLFPELEEVLSETYGVICYQEQVMKISQVIAGFSMAEADVLRKAVAKKKGKLMEEVKIKFLAGAKANDFDMEKVEELFSMIEKFAKYSFNKSHSAAYAKLAMQTAYLKKKHIAKFLAAAISVESSDSKKVYEYIIEARRHGLKILLPDINVSDKDAKAVGDNAIMLGIGNLKGFGDTAIEDILKFRPFLNPVDLIMRTKKVNKTMVKKLITIGNFDFLGFKREDMWLTIDKFNKTKAKKTFSSFLSGKASSEFKPLEAGFKWTKQDMAQMEYDAFGFFLFENPIASYKDLMVYSNYDEIVFVEKVKKTKTKKTGDEMAIIKVTDFNTYKEIPIFPRVWSQCQCKEGDVMMIKYSGEFPGEIIKAEDAKYEFRYLIINAGSVPVDDVIRVLNKYPKGNIITDIRDHDMPGPKIAFNMQLIDELTNMGCNVKFDK